MTAHSTEPRSGYYAPLAIVSTHRTGAWTFDVGQTPDGKWVVEATSTAAPRPQRLYYDSRAEADDYVAGFGS